MRPKLLLADDSVTIQRVIELTFAEEDITVLTAGDGRQAIERVQADRPDIVLADVGMPERDGYQVAEFIKHDPQLAHIPVLLLTGAFEPVDESRARTIGCEGVLVKPFEPQMVISRVRELLRGPGQREAAPAAPAADTRVAARTAAAPGIAAPSVSAGSHARAEGGAAGEASGSGDTLEAYFDRLDAALANLGTAPPPVVVALEEADRGNAEKDARRAGPRSRGDAARTAAFGAGTPFSRPEPVSGVAAAANEAIESAGISMPALHAAFAALLAAERGESAGPLVPQPDAAPVLTEEAVDDIVQRVIERMGDARMRALVLDTAERLVREEIDRLKRQK